MDRRRLAAEAFGTFWLVLGGCGAAVLAGPDIGNLGVSLAFGLSVLTMAHAVGGISGGHFNPAVTIGLLVAGRFDRRDVPAYLAAQVTGAVLAAVILAAIASGVEGFAFGDGGPGVPVSNTSVNPARSVSQALFAGGDALIQLPVFIVAPMAGAALGALAWSVLLAGPEETNLAEGVTAET